MFDIDVSILGQKPIGLEALEPFGYDVFAPQEGTFDPPSTGPVPPDYVLGPGDTVRVQLFGNVNGIYEYEVTRDGILNLPEIGPVTVDMEGTACQVPLAAPYIQKVIDKQRIGKKRKTARC